uniref:cGMP-dependent protein kinase n=1 Tax=Hirondellea gigas TaxID=1518452 RepID=A0A6A7G739_9CRUS
MGTCLARQGQNPKDAHVHLGGGKRSPSASFSRLSEDFEMGETLKSVPLLHRLTDNERAKLGAAFTECRFTDGSIVFRQGDIGSDFYIIKLGKAIVTTYTQSGDSKEDTVLAHLERNDYFGETALTSEEPRGATVAAEGTLVCLKLGKSAFTSLFGGQRLNVQFAKRNAISAEVFEAQAMAMDTEKRDREKGNETKELIRDAVTKNILFANLDVVQLTEIVDAMYRKNVPSGDTIITQGESGDKFYVVESGCFEVFVTKEGTTRMVVKRVRGTSFGELALMYNSPRAATVKAVADSVVWAVDRMEFRKIVMKVSENKLKEYENFLVNVDLFTSLLSNERSKIAEALEEVTFQDGEVIVEQGDEGETFYVIRSGYAVVTKQEEGEDQPREILHYKSGDFFGERALISKEPRAATVTVRGGPMQCLTLDSLSFTLLLGPLREILDRRVENYDAPRSSAQSPEGDNFLDVKRKDLIILGTLGKGSFGHVQLVRDRKSNQTFALKSVSKAQVVHLGQQDHVMSEKYVMSKLSNRFLINLCQTYNSHDTLYFLLEVSLGGELFSILRNKTIFDEKTSRFFAGSVLLAFEYMHDKKIIYRDLKPENLLLNAKGYLKITDFGFAKVVPDRTWTLCGTPDYLAPEVVSGQGHGKGVDYWTLGILIYEMLAAYPPFYDEDQMKTYAKIMHGTVTYPKHFSHQAKDLISRLLHMKPTKRLGVVKGGATNVKEHPWFDGFNWEALAEGRMLAPIIPEIRGDDDLSNFEEYPDEDEEIPPYEDDNSGWDDDF